MAGLPQRRDPEGVDPQRGLPEVSQNPNGFGEIKSPKKIPSLKLTLKTMKIPPFLVNTIKMAMLVYRSVNQFLRNCVMVSGFGYQVQFFEFYGCRQDYTLDEIRKRLSTISTKTWRNCCDIKPPGKNEKRRNKNAFLLVDKPGWGLKQTRAPGWLVGNPWDDSSPLKRKPGSKKHLKMDGWFRYVQMKFPKLG